MSINAEERAEILKELDAEVPAEEVKEPEQPAEEVKPAESEAKPPEKPAEAKPPVEDEVTRLKAELETTSKRLKDTQQWGHTLSQRLKDTEVKPKEAEATKPPELSEDAKLYVETPGFMEAVRHYASKTIEPINMENQQNRVALAGILKVMVRNEILTAHPDADTVTKSEDWNQWVTSQPEFVKTIIKTSFNPQDTIAVLNEFKEHKKRKDFVQKQEIETKKKTAALSVAETLPGGANFIPNANNPDEDTSDIDQLNDEQILKRVRSRGHGVV